MPPVLPARGSQHTLGCCVPPPGCLWISCVFSLSQRAPCSFRKDTHRLGIARLLNVFLVFLAVTFFFFRNTNVHSILVFVYLPPLHCAYCLVLQHASVLLRQQSVHFRSREGNGQTDMVLFLYESSIVTLKGSVAAPSVCPGLSTERERIA